MKRSEIIVSAGLVPIDYLMIVLAGILAYFIRYWEPIKAIRPIIFDLSFNVFFDWLFLIALLWVISFALAGLYSMKGTSRAIDEMSKIFLGSSTAVMFLMFIFFFSRSLFESRFIILFGWLFAIILVMVGRGIARFIQRRLYYFNIGVHRVVIIGTGLVAEEVISDLSNNVKSGFKVVSQFALFDDGTAKKLAELKIQDKFDEILVATAELSSKNMEKLNDFSYVNHVDLKYVANVFDFPINNFQIVLLAGLPIVELKKTKLGLWGRILKRIFDIIVSAVLIILLSPILILTAIAIKLDSCGKIFFSYNRIGERGEPFTYFKFRSMVSDAHKLRFDPEFVKSQKNLRDGTPMMKFADDPRITKVGKFIRRFSIDELPELFNVFIGKMSLVGPRPHEVEEVAKYENFHRRVLSIKPGMTGMAQVSGRSDLNFDEEVRLDVWYMENWSMKLDLIILFKTPWAVLKKRKSE